MFHCKKNHGVFTSLNNIVKYDDFMYVNPGFYFGRRESFHRGSRHSLARSQSNLHRGSPHELNYQHDPSEVGGIHYQNHFFATIRDGSPERPVHFEPFASIRTDTDTEDRGEDNAKHPFDLAWNGDSHRRRSSNDQQRPPNIGKPKENISVSEAEIIMARLKEAVAFGNHGEAARLAKEVSKLHITAKLINKELLTQDCVRSKPEQGPKPRRLRLKMFVEDQESHSGPFTVLCLPSMTLGELKKLVESQFEIPTKVQKWILDKTLGNDDGATLESFGINCDDQNIYLYIIVPVGKTDEQTTSIAKSESVEALKPDASGETKKPTLTPVQERRGRYWNYEHNRWSFCSEDDDEQMQVKETYTDADTKKEDSKKENETTATQNQEVTPEDDDYEWEYYYEDAEVFPDQTATVAKRWRCPNCTLLNDDDRPGCGACAAPKPQADHGPPQEDEGAAGEDRPGDAEKTKLLENYKKLDDLDLIPNIERFECVVCFLEIEPGDGVVLRECLHTFCRECLQGAIEHSESPQVGCPYKDDNYSCDMVILDREIKSLVLPAVYEKLQQKSLQEAQAKSENTFQCKTPDCDGWCFVNDAVNTFKCPICSRVNCITCQAIHEGLDCKQHQLSMLNEAQDENSIKTKQWIEGLIATGEALKCPSCQVLLLKKWGCDWVRCTYCRTEICWVTRQLRWGPNGKGDTSGGCRCMADGRTKCHPMCNYCH